jgi:Flp pilus assembly protein TadG
MGHIHTRRFANAEAGSAIIEFALASALFFATLFGILGFGQAVWRFNMMANLALEGARWASVRGSGATGVVVPASATDVQTYVRTRALGLNVAVATTRVDATTKACTSTSVDPSTLSAGGRLCVNVINTFTPLTSLIPSATMILQSTTQMTVVR